MERARPLRWHCTPPVSPRTQLQLPPDTRGACMVPIKPDWKCVRSGGRLYGAVRSVSRGGQTHGVNFMDWPGCYTAHPDIDSAGTAFHTRVLFILRLHLSD